MPPSHLPVLPAHTSPSWVLTQHGWFGVSHEVPVDVPLPLDVIEPPEVAAVVEPLPVVLDPCPLEPVWLLEAPAPEGEPELPGPPFDCPHPKAASATAMVTRRIPLAFPRCLGGHCPISKHIASAT
jgi:hypothetical protein